MHTHTHAHIHNEIINCIVENQVKAFKFQFGTRANMHKIIPDSCQTKQVHWIVFKIQRQIQKAPSVLMQKSSKTAIIMQCAFERILLF